MRGIITVAGLLLFFIVASALPVNADTITSSSHHISFSAGESFSVESLVPEAVINFTVSDGTLDATQVLILNSTCGSITMLSQTDGKLTVDAPSNMNVYVGNVLYTGEFSFSSSAPLVISWFYNSEMPTVVGEDDAISYAVVAGVLCAVVVALAFYLLSKRGG